MAAEVKGSNPVLNNAEVKDTYFPIATTSGSCLSRRLFPILQTAFSVNLSCIRFLNGSILAIQFSEFWMCCSYSCRASLTRFSVSTRFSSCHPCGHRSYELMTLYPKTRQVHKQPSKRDPSVCGSSLTTLSRQARRFAAVDPIAEEESLLRYL